MQYKREEKLFIRKNAYGFLSEAKIRNIKKKIGCRIAKKPCLSAFTLIMLNYCIENIFSFGS